MQLFLQSFRLAFFATILILSSCMTTKGQSSAKYTTRKTTNEKALALYKKGRNYAQQRKYDKAIATFQKALKKDEKLVDATIQIAGILYEQGHFHESTSYYLQAIKRAPNYKPRSYYALGIIAQKSKKYDLAIQRIEQYLAFPDIRPRYKQRAQKRLQNLQFIAEATQHPVPFTPKNLGPNINTKSPEYLPSFTADEQFFIFTRRVYNQEDFYISQKVNGEFQKATPMTAINTDKNEGAQCISSDGRFLAMTLCGRDRTQFGSCDIYFSRKENGAWTNIQNIGGQINSKYWDAQPSLSANGDALYFASERPGGLGKRDIWVSYKKENGQWGKPQNLGDAINTPGADQAPFIHPDGKTIYFMSDGHPGMGQGDLFMSKKQPDGTWSKAKNLGYPINTEGDQGAMVVSLDGTKAYYAGTKSSAPEEDFFGGAIDIFEFDMPLSIRPDPVTYVKGIVQDADSGKKITDAIVELINLQNGKTIFHKKVDADGAFLTVLPKGQYAMNVHKDQYAFFSENYLLLETHSLDKPFALVAKLHKLNKKKNNTTTTKIILKNVFFDSGSAILDPSSNFELNRVLAMLQKAPELTLQINGHTDNIGSTKDNLLLSEQRAKAVYDYLINHGAQAKQLRYKGFGESQPIDTNDTEAGRKNNRRTEMEY